MDASTLFYTVVSAVGTIFLGVIAYFLKRTISLVDSCAKDVKTLDASKVAQSDLTDYKQEVKGQIDKITHDIETIREDYITKEDFYREQAKTERKLDMIIDILMGRSKNG